MTNAIASSADGDYVESIMRCAIYARYSSDLQHGRSIDDQVRNCRKFADRKGWFVLDDCVYSDQAKSGATLVGRPGVQALLKDACGKPSPFDYVLVDDTSRLSRDKVDQSTAIRDLEECGVFVYFVSDSIDTRDETACDVLLPVYGIKDSMYIRDLGKKTKRGMEGQALKGFNAGGRTYGYKYTPVPDPSGVIDKKTRMVRSLGTRIDIEPDHAKVVKAVFSMYADGSGLKAVATNLTDQGVDPPRKALQIHRGRAVSSWCPNAIRAMLRNPKYIGDWTWNKTRSVRKRKTGKRVYVQRPKDEWVVIKRPDLAIVDQELWDTVHERIRESSWADKTRDRSPRRKYLLSGLLRCGICGANLIVAKTYGGKDVEYRCSFNWQRGAKACPNNVRIRGSEVEGRVIDALRDQLLRPEVLELIVEKTNQIIRERLSGRREDRDRLVAERNRVAGEIQNIIAYIGSSGTAPASLRDAILQKEQELEVLESQISGAMADEISEFRVDPQQVTRWFYNLKELISRDMVAGRREISNLIGTLTAKPVSTMKDRSTGLLLTGKPNVEGVLGIVGATSNLHNGGGRI